MYRRVPSFVARRAVPVAVAMVGRLVVATKFCGICIFPLVVFLRMSGDPAAHTILRWPEALFLRRGAASAGAIVTRGKISKCLLNIF